MWRQNNRKLVSSIELTLADAKKQLDQMDPTQVMVIQSSNHMISISKEEKDSFSFYDPNARSPIDSLTEKALLEVIKTSLNAKPSDQLIYAKLVETSLREAVFVKLSVNATTVQAPGGPKPKGTS